MDDLVTKIRKQFSDEFTRTGLRIFITVWAVLVIILAWTIQNQWILAGIAAWEVLP